MEQQQSNSGKHLQGLINDLQLQTVSIISPQGAWTWVNRNNQEEHSVIQYIITSQRWPSK